MKNTRIGIHLALLSSLLLWMLMVLASCSVNQKMTDQNGTVIFHDVCSVTVEYDVIVKTKKGYVYINDKVLNTFYYPKGHSYKLGDKY